MKKLGFLIFIITMLTVMLFNETGVIFALDNDYYIIYNKNGEQVCMRTEGVEIGSGFVTKDNEMYEIIEIDEEKKTCTAQFVKKVELPKVTTERNNLSANQVNVLIELDKRAGIYITHNDESYIPSDGTESIYGRGGIHDVALAFADALRNEGFIVDVDETLHLPHDTSAYSRSRNTANDLLRKQDLDVLIDVHRDGAPRKIYDTEVGGVPMSKVRIVVGQRNPNFDDNYQFALELKALADQWYPGLINDIYLGLGDYNQDLLNQAILLEFGSEEIEKELALKSVVPMANVINGVIQQRAVSGASTLRTKQLSSTGYNSTIFNLLIALGIIIVIIFILFLISPKFRGFVLGYAKDVNSGLFITRKRP